MYNKTDFIKQSENTKQEIIKMKEDFLSKKSYSDIISYYKDYNELQKHSHYSFNNYFLAMVQAEKQNLEFKGILNNYNNWQAKQATVIKGSKSLKILIPIPFKKKSSTDNDKEEFGVFFKLGNVFDISQTSLFTDFKKQEKELNEKIYDNHFIDYHIAENLVKQNFNHDIIYTDDITALGSYNIENHTIKIKDKTAHTLLHEFSHYITITKLKMLDSIKGDDYIKGELIAEVCCFLLMQKIDKNIKYNFNYSNIWANRLSKDINLSAFEKIVKTIKPEIDTLQGL